MAGAEQSLLEPDLMVAQLSLLQREQTGPGGISLRTAGQRRSARPLKRGAHLRPMVLPDWGVPPSGVTDTVMHSPV